MPVFLALDKPRYQRAVRNLAKSLWQEIQRRKIHLEFDEAAYNRYTMFLMNSTPAAWLREIMEHDMAYTNWFEKQVELRLKAEREKRRRRHRRQ